MIKEFENISQENSDRCAYRVGLNEISYGELWNEARKYANFLKVQGEKPVIIYGHKSVQMIISIFACILAKRTYIPIEKNTPISRINEIIDMANVGLIILNEEINVKETICKEVECITLEELNEKYFYEIDDNQLDFEDEKSLDDASQIAYIIFTSGSTGSPKGVPISVKNLENFIKWIRSISPLKEYKHCNVLNEASFSFDLSVADIFYSLFNGHTLVSTESFEFDNLNCTYDVIKKNDINVIVSTPTFMKLCVISDEFNVGNYPSLKCLYFCGEKLDKSFVSKIFERFPDVKIINAYGPTEATSAVSSIIITKEMLECEEELPVGLKENFATDIVIEDGEIVLKGDSVFSGYLSGLTGGHFKEDNINCFRTGDIGEIRENKLYCKGRKDNQIKFKGYRIELGDIENNLKNIDGVEEAAVIAKRNQAGDVKVIKAFVVLANNTSIEEIKEKLGNMIPKYMMPSIVKKVDKLPINANGKIDRKLLMEL